MCIRVLCRDIRADVLIEELEHKWNAVRKHEMLTHVLKLYSINHITMNCLMHTTINPYRKTTHNYFTVSIHCVQEKSSTFIFEHVFTITGSIFYIFQFNI